MSKKLKYYALGMKGWAEIRKSATPPEPVKTSVDVPYKKTKYTLSQTSFVGGRVVGVVPIHTLRNHGVALVDGGIAEVPDRLRPMIQKWAG